MLVWLCHMSTDRLRVCARARTKCHWLNLCKSIQIHLELPWHFEHERYIFSPKYFFSSDFVLHFHFIFFSIFENVYRLQFVNVAGYCSFARSLVFVGVVVVQCVCATVPTTVSSQLHLRFLNATFFLLVLSLSSL